MNARFSRTVLAVAMVVAGMMMGTAAWADRGDPDYRRPHHDRPPSHHEYYRDHHPHHRHHDDYRYEPRYDPPYREHHPYRPHYYRNHWIGDVYDYPLLSVSLWTPALALRLTPAQVEYYATAQQRVLRAPVGETVHWDGDDAYSSLTTTRIIHNAEGRTCREFQQEVRIGGEREQAYGTACLQADGSWKVMKKG